MAIVTPEYLFIFGTLKTDFPNCSYNQAEKIEGQFKTLHKFPLYLVGNRYSPWLVNSPGQGYQVSGEVYKTDEHTISTMDALERIHEPDGYRRQRIEVVNLQNNQHSSIWAYMKPEEQLEIAEVMSGPFATYTLEHAQLYRSRNHVG